MIAMTLVGVAFGATLFMLILQVRPPKPDPLAMLARYDQAQAASPRRPETSVAKAGAETRLGRWVAGELARRGITYTSLRQDLALNGQSFESTMGRKVVVGVVGFLVGLVLAVSLGVAGAFAALELTILVPFVLVMLLLVVGFGRVERGRELVDQASQAAARAASLAPNPAAAQSAATEAAQQTLRNGGLSCTGGGLDAYADTANFGPGGSVTAHVSCTTSLSDLAMAGFPGHTTLISTSTSTIGQYQQTSTGSGA